MQSFQSLRGARWGTNGRNPEDGRDFTILTTAQQVLRVVLLFPVLGRKILLPSRKGAWDRMRKGLVPLSAGGRPDKGFLEHPHETLDKKFFVVIITYSFYFFEGGVSW